MSGNRYVKRDGEWRCSRCNNSNYAWRQQCYRCNTGKNSSGSEEGGLGIGTALLVGAGAAAVGLLAQGLWNTFQGSSDSSSGTGNNDPRGPRRPPPQGPRPSTFNGQGRTNNFASSGTGNNDPRGPRRPPPRGPRPSTSNGQGKTNNLGARKKQRDSNGCQDQNIPDQLKCAICLFNPREVCMLPCGHVCLCEDCAEKVETKCPLCQRPIERKQAVYL